jgi:branched-chain amino acid transport system permease protein
VASTASAGSIAAEFGVALPPAWAELTVTQLAPVLPYLLLVVMLAMRPHGLFGERTRDA